MRFRDETTRQGEQGNETTNNLNFLPFSPLRYEVNHYEIHNERQKLFAELFYAASQIVMVVKEYLILIMYDALLSVCKSTTETQHLICKWDDGTM